MKFFTRELYNAVQPRSGVDEDLAERMWSESSAAYQRRLAEILPLLSPAAQRLAETTYHDGVVAEVERTGPDRVKIHIDARANPWGPAGEFVLEFTGVRESAGLEEIAGDDWLYEEVDVASQSAFEYRVLLTRSELRIVAENIEISGKRFLTIYLDEQKLQRLEQAATSSGIDASALTQTILEEWLDNRCRNFDTIAQYVIEKNKELYQRLAASDGGLSHHKTEDA